MSQVIPFGKPVKRDYFDALSPEQVAKLAIALANVDEVLLIKLTDQEEEDLNLWIQSELIALKLVRQGIVL